MASRGGLGRYLLYKDKWLEEGFLTLHQAKVFEQLVYAKHHKLLSAFDSYSQPEQDQRLRETVNIALLEHLQSTWAKLFSGLSTNKGKKISKAERASLGITRGTTTPFGKHVSPSSLVYGEISFDSLGAVLWGPNIKRKPGGTFVDLGSGTGRGIFAAALLHNFDKCIGVEILEGLHEAALGVLKRFDADVRPNLADKRQRSMEISFVRDSFLQYDWSDADVVFANSTCFDEHLMREVTRLGKNLKDGAYVVTLTKKIRAPHFENVHSKQYSMSWGLATVHIHQKITPGFAAGAIPAGLAGGVQPLDPLSQAVGFDYNPNAAAIRKQQQVKAMEAEEDTEVEVDGPPKETTDAIAREEAASPDDDLTRSFLE